MKTYWISFGAPEEKGGNKGCCIIEAQNPVAAVERTKELGIFQQQAEPMIIEMDVTDETAQDEISRWGKDKLISAAELRADNYSSTLELSDETNAKIDADPKVTRICKDCNSTGWINLLE